jgi:hypothetical protein
MLASEPLDEHVRPDAHAYCCVPRLLLLCLQESMCMGPPNYIRERAQRVCPNMRKRPIGERERRENNAHTYVLIWVHSPPWGTKPGGAWWCRDALFCVRWVLACSNALHSHVHFDPGVLSRLDIDRPLRAHSTVGVGPHDRDR